MTDQVLAAIETSIRAADSRYGPFASVHEAVGVALEEWDELRDAMRKNDLPCVANECIDLAAVLVRLARALYVGETELLSRSVK